MSETRKPEDASLAELEEQQRRYDELERETSESLAYFYCCLIFDIPFDMKALPGAGERRRWISYRDNLRIKGLDRTKGGEPYRFVDGLTDITKIFGVGLESGEFSKAVDNEKSARDIKAGTNAQRANWGRGSEKNPYTTEDYKRLDDLFSIYSRRLRDGGGMDTQQEFILRKCASMTLQQEKCLAGGYFDKAAKLDKMIQDNLASENLRKRDEKPVEDLRIDTLVTKLEEAGLLKNGKQCEPDEMFQILFGRAPKYTYTKDAVEQFILINENRMRENDGEATLQMLPDSMRLEDNLHEFAETPNAKELEAYEKLGLVKLPPKGAEVD